MATSKTHRNLHDAPWYEFLSPLVVAFLKRHRRSSRGKGDNRATTLADMYVIECFRGGGELVAACDQLEFALVYLSGYQRRRTPGGLLISRADHIAYELENFMIRLGMIEDRALKLVNSAFQLGIQPKDCRRSTVAENAHVANTPIGARLKAIERAISPHRSTRNRIVHEKGYSDEEMRKLAMFSELQKSALESDPFILHWAQFHKTQADNYVKAKRHNLSKTVDVVFECVAELLRNLLPIVQRTYRVFSAP